MTTHSNRGRVAEALIRKNLVQLENSADFAQARWPDAHGGSLVTALADFLVMRSGKMTLLEVKEVAHSYRLPYSSFKSSQIAKMRMWKMAGANGHVLIYHSNDKTWRAADVSWFFLNHKTLSDDGKPIGSWDMRDVPLIGLDDYFSTFLGA
jgi:hypothetical protein